MKKMVNLSYIILVLTAGLAGAQTAVTNNNDGTTNTVPVYTGSATLGNSPIAVSGGNVGIGTNAPTLPFVVTRSGSFYTALSVQYTQSSQAIAKGFILSKPALLQVVGGEADNNSYAEIGLVQPGVQNGSVPWLAFASTRSTTAQINSATFNALQANDLLGGIGFGGDNGVSMRATGALIRSYATAAWSSSSTPSSIQFLTTPQGSTTTANRMIIADSGNVGIGTGNPGATLEVNGTAKVDSTLQVSSSGIVFPGSSTPQTTPWTGVLCGGDYAEAVKAAGQKQIYEPGDVLVLASDSKSDVTKSSKPYSTMVAGIYATKPGVIGRRQSLKDESEEVPMAMVGIVPTNVTAQNGPIRRGDLLVSSSVPGFAMKGTDRSRMLGAVIGKAMGSLDSGQGVIDVLVTLQ